MIAVTAGHEERAVSNLQWRVAAWLAGTAAAAIVGAVVVLQLWKADLRIPFAYRGDAYSYQLWVKSVLEHGSWLHTPEAGAPFGFHSYDFPCFDGLHLLVIRLMGLFSKDWGLLINLYFLLGFPAIALTSFVVLRQIRISPGPAFVASLLFAFLPTRLSKGEGHIFMVSFWQVPFALLLAHWLIRDERPPIFGAKRSLSLAAVALCLVIGTTGLYYAFFTGVLLTVVGAWTALGRRRWRPVLASAALSGIILTGLFVQALPSLIYQHRHGKNPEVAVRGNGEAELYGLKIAQLLLPVVGHRVPALARLTQRYEATSPMVNENRETSLGLVGSLGFLLLLFRLVAWRRKDGMGDPYEPLPLLNFSMLLLGTVGGFGSLFALLVSPQIRGYCRSNVLIAYFALTAVAIALDRQRHRLPAGRLGRTMGTASLAALTLLGLYDQSTPGFVPPYAETAATFHSDQNFVRRIEAVLPSGAAVFQLPFVTFPEVAETKRMLDYDELRAFLQSRSLRWSYPVMRNREGDVWSPVVSERPGRMLTVLAAAGFDGVYIDRSGYPDEGSELEAALGNVLDQEPLESEDRRLAFYDLRAFASRERAKYTEARWERLRRRVLYPLSVQFEDGFYDLEHAEGHDFHWCRGACELRFFNRDSMPRELRVTMHFRTAILQPSHMRIVGDAVQASIDIPTEGFEWQRAFVLPPGEHSLWLVSDATPVTPDGDPRDLAFRLDDLRAQDDF